MEPIRLIATLFALFGLTLLSGLFALAETALISSRKGRVDQLVREKRGSATLLRKILTDLPRFLAAMQVALTLFEFLGAILAAVLLIPVLDIPLAKTGLLPVWRSVVSIALLTLGVTLSRLVLVEIVPKALGAKNPESWALRAAPLIYISGTAFVPLAYTAVKIAEFGLKPLGLQARFEMPLITEEELKHIIDAGEEAGELEEDERDMLKNVFDLGETPVRVVMTPRTKMTALAVTRSLEEMLDVIMTSGHSRIPVYDTNVDNITGIVYAKDLLPYLKENRRDTPLSEIQREAIFVPRTKSVGELLAQFRRTTQQFAIVLDEDAGTAGIVTIEDLLEEIVGDIKDEYDVDEPEFLLLPSGDSLFDAQTAISEVNERLDIQLPRDEYDVIGAFIFHELGHEPVEGDSVEIEGVRFEVVSVEDHWIKKLRAVSLKE